MSNKWTNQEWHSPDGRTVYIKPNERPCVVSVHFKGGERPRDLIFDLGKREIDFIDVDGRIYLPEDPDVQYELRDGLITAVVLGGARYLREKPKDFDDVEVD